MGQILQQLQTSVRTEAEESVAVVDLPYIEMDLSIIGGGGPVLDLVENMLSPRTVKTHLEVKFYERAIKQRKTKFIVVMRNIKDTLVSYYHIYRSATCFGQMTGTFEDFMDLYRRNKMQNWFDWKFGLVEISRLSQCNIRQVRRYDSR